MVNTEEKAMVVAAAWGSSSYSAPSCFEEKDL